MILKIYEQFGVEAFHILKKYENQMIIISTFRNESQPLVIDFIKKFGEPAKRFFKMNAKKKIDFKNAEKSLKRFLNKQIKKDIIKVVLNG
jgi:hypothetical protein